MKTLFAEIWSSLLLTLLFCLALGIGYPVVVWAGGRLLFPAQAGGSLVVDASGAVRGSSLLAQNFASDRYFWPRSSAAGNGWDAINSGGTNYGPTSAKLASDLKGRIQAYRQANGLAPDAPVPADAVTSSGSGLDPDISPENAQDQAARVARARGRPVEEVRALIAARTTPRDAGVFGEPRVNVLQLNLALDQAGPKGQTPAP